MVFWIVVDPKTPPTGVSELSTKPKIPTNPVLGVEIALLSTCDIRAQVVSHVFSDVENLLENVENRVEAQHGRFKPFVGDWGVGWEGHESSTLDETGFFPIPERVDQRVEILMNPNEILLTHDLDVTPSPVPLGTAYHNELFLGKETEF